jgi:peptidoglycan-associated lipoprotein
MSHKRSLAFGLVALSPIFLACPPKKPVTPADDISTRTQVVTPPAAEEIKQPATPSSAGDRTQDPLSQDLQSVNAYAAQQGLIGDVFFELDKSDLSAASRERLAKNAQFLNAHPEFAVTVEGHCDERGTNEYNLALGDRRANAAKEYLQSLGVAATRLRTISYGEERPFCAQGNESCWSQNRRSHFVISGRTNVG